MDVKALIVGKGVADAMLKCADMRVDPNYDNSSGIRRVGLYGDIPVWLDPLFAINKVMITYQADPGDEDQDQGMVDRWKDHPDGENWILLADSPRGQREAHTTTTGGAQVPS